MSYTRVCEAAGASSSTPCSGLSFTTCKWGAFVSTSPLLLLGFWTGLTQRASVYPLPIGKVIALSASVPMLVRPGCWQIEGQRKGGGGCMGFSHRTCWKPSRPPLHPTSFDELSIAVSAHSLQSEFPKSPRANMRRRMIERGCGLGLGGILIV